MKPHNCVALVASASLLFSFSGPPAISFASAVYNCANAAACSGNGGNGDNGTNNGNNSSNNVVNVNFLGRGLSQDGSSVSQAAYGYSGSLALPQFPALGCGSRATAYAGVTGSPVAGYSNMGFGFGFLAPVGREPEICRPQPIQYAPQQSYFAQPQAQMQMQQQAQVLPQPQQQASSFARSLPISAAPSAMERRGPADSSAGQFVVVAPSGERYVMVPQAQTQAPISYRAATAAPAPSEFVGSRVPAMPSLRGTSPAVSAATQSAPASCAHLDADLADYYEKDLRAARASGDSNRIVRDIQALDQACYHAFVLRALKGH